MVAPDGKRYDLKPDLVDLGYAPKEGFHSAKFAPAKAGLYVAAQSSDAVVNHGKPVRSVRSAKTYFVVSPSLDKVREGLTGLRQAARPRPGTGPGGQPGRPDGTGDADQGQAPVQRQAARGDEGELRSARRHAQGGDRRRVRADDGQGRAGELHPEDRATTTSSSPTTPTAERGEKYDEHEVRRHADRARPGEVPVLRRVTAGGAGPHLQWIEEDMNAIRMTGAVVILASAVFVGSGQRVTRQDAKGKPATIARPARTWRSSSTRAWSCSTSPGPGEVFAAAGSGRAFHVYTVAADADPIISQGFLTVTPGVHPRRLPEAGRHRPARRGDRRPAQGPEGRRVGEEGVGRRRGDAVGLHRGVPAGEAGLLDGKEATTHWGSIEALRKKAPKTTVHADRRFVDNGKVVTAAGVSAGIDASLHVVERLLGKDAAATTARYMEYRREPARSDRTNDPSHGTTRERQPGKGILPCANNELSR